jgi:hypothetical protein
MDVVKLDPTSYLPTNMVEGYNSMIWTERNLENGEFQMSTAKVGEMRALIPDGSLISLRDSDEVMFVENHRIKRDEKGAATSIITGRTFETYLENRVATGVYNTPWKAIKQYTTAQAAAFLIWNHLVNTTNQDPSRTGQVKDALTALANVVATDSTTVSEPVKDWYFEQGEIYKQLRDVLSLGRLGVRNIRPKNSTGNVTTFDTSATAGVRGTATKTSTPNLTNLRIDVYNGVDRTRQQSVVAPVIFHYDSGHIVNPEYLFSIKDYKVMATVASSLGNTDVWPDNVVPAVIPSGINRRILFVDGGTLPDANSVIQKGTIELRNHIRKILFDGAISAASPYKYGVEYFLGDKVTLMAEFGFENTMTVAEYVRTQDHEGDRGYPTLISAT